MKIAWGISGSYCNHQKVLNQIKQLITKGYFIQPIVSHNTIAYSTRFGDNEQFINDLQTITGNEVMSNIVESETIGPNCEFDVCVIAPCTATTISKLVHGDYDHSVTLCAKAILRNNLPLIIGIASNDILGISGENLMKLAQIKNIYIVPFYQDDYRQKPNSCISKWELIDKTISCALKGKQIQPLLYTKEEDYEL